MATAPAPVGGVESLSGRVEGGVDFTVKHTVSHGFPRTKNDEYLHLKQPP